jgi:hypothetical protein
MNKKGPKIWGLFYSRNFQLKAIFIGCDDFVCNFSAQLNRVDVVVAFGKALQTHKHHALFVAFRDG